MDIVVLEKQQSRCLDLLKGVAILMVLFIHVDFRKNLNVEPLSSFDIYMQTVTRILCDNAVPMFFFVSGLFFFLKKILI